MFVPSQYSYVKTLTLPSNVIVGGGAFGRNLGHEDRAFMNAMNAMNALMKGEKRKRVDFLLPCEDTMKRHPSTSQEEGPHQEANL